MAATKTSVQQTKTSVQQPRPLVPAASSTATEKRFICDNGVILDYTTRRAIFSAVMTLCGEGEARADSKPVVSEVVVQGKVKGVNINLDLLAEHYPAALKMVHTIVTHRREILNRPVGVSAKSNK